jgi:hemerythrin-like domain-containing protein
MTLIERLTSEHNALREAMEQINRLRISQPEGREILFKTKAMLIAHLALEDQELYPALDLLAANKVLASSFRQEMQEISARVLEFFKKYESGIADGFAFARDFGHIKTMLVQRMIREETRLYPAFQQNKAV